MKRCLRRASSLDSLRIFAPSGELTDSVETVELQVAVVISDRLRSAEEAFSARQCATTSSAEALNNLSYGFMALSGT